MRCVPPYSRPVTLYTGRQAGLGGPGRPGWGCLGSADCAVLRFMCFVGKYNTEDDENDSDNTNYIINL